MVIGIKDVTKLFAISIVTFCAVFVCTLFLNYNIDIAQIKDEITTEQGKVIYDAMVSTGKVVVIVSGGCLTITSIIMLIFYIKNYIDSHGKELGILKALGYSNWKVARHFWIFGLSVLIGCVLGHLVAWGYLPTFYEVQNKEQLLPNIVPQFHLLLTLGIIGLPSIVFMVLSVLYTYFKMRVSVLHLLKGIQRVKIKKQKKETKEESFMQEVQKNTLRSRKILVFFMGFSAFCFSAMTQMSLSMKDLSSENFSWMILSIGLILAFMTLFMSLTSVIKANTKTIAMMKVFGYSQRECTKAVLDGYRPVSYLGFIIGTVYQYMLLKIVVNVIFMSYENMPEYHFHWDLCLLCLVAFCIVYEIFLQMYSRKVSKVPMKEIMLEN